MTEKNVTTRPDRLPLDITTATTALMIVPPPLGLPEKIGQAYSKAMEEVAHLLDDPEVHRRFAYLLLTELRLKSALQSCSPASLITAIVEMAEENLDPSGINECFLVPYQGEVKMQRGYAGLVKLACSHPEVLDIFADEVCVNDTYEFYGVNMRPKHVYPGAFQPRGRYIGYYAVAQLTQGRWRAVQMSVDELKAHAVHYSQNATKKVWSEERGGGFRGMALKTVLRKICNPKYIPMSARVYEKLRQQDIVEGLIVNNTLMETREPLSAREPEKTATEHIADLCGDDQRGSTPQASPGVQDETEEVIEHGETPPGPAHVVGDPGANQGHIYPSAWRDTLEAHKDDTRLQEGLRAKMKLALNPGSKTGDAKGLALAGAVLDCLHAPEEDTQTASRIDTVTGEVSSV